MGLGGYEVKKLLLFKFLIKQGRAEGPMNSIAQGSALGYQQEEK